VVDLSCQARQSQRLEALPRRFHHQQVEASILAEPIASADIRQARQPARAATFGIPGGYLCSVDGVSGSPGLRSLQA
jgi:hypothetical protein